MPAAVRKIGSMPHSMESIYPSAFKAPDGLKEQVFAATSKEKVPRE